jgi:hypothetical protein
MMNRKFRAFGLAFAAVIAMAAFSGTASAAEFHSEVAHTQISGTQIGTDVFTVNAGTVKCTEATYSGTQTTGVTSSEVTVLPKYGGCTAFGFVNTPIDVNGCHYTFTPNANPYVHINCGEKFLTVTAFNCEVTVPSQTVQSGVTYTNEGAGTSRDVRVKVNLTGITYIQHSKNFPGCNTRGTNNEETTAFHDGTYTGEATIKGANTAGAQVGIWWQ